MKTQMFCFSNFEKTRVPALTLIGAQRANGVTAHLKNNPKYVVASGQVFLSFKLQFYNEDDLAERFKECENILHFAQ